MKETYFSQLSRILFTQGVSGGDIGISTIALIAAWHEGRNIDNPQQLFLEFANRLDESDPSDGIKTAQDWLTDPNLKPLQWDTLQHALDVLQKSPARPIDWSAELSDCVTNASAGHFGFSPTLPVSRALARIIDIPISQSCACLFPGSALVAWVLSADREVTFYSAQQDLAVIMALAARAACRTLHVDRRNPFDGSYMPAQHSFDSDDNQPPFDRFDHIFSAPPFGVRISNGPSKGMPFETYQIDRLAKRATKSFTSIVTDGVLFRESRNEAELRRRLAEQYETTVMSLPQGMFGPTSGISTSLLHLEPGPSDAVRLIDGRSMEKSSSGRIQEQLIVRHLEDFHGFEQKDETRTDIFKLDELEAANFSLLPDRYLRSESLAQIEDALQNREQVALEQVADVVRNKAPTPIRDVVEDPPLAALEIAPADIVDGNVRIPRRQLAFERDQAGAIEKVTVDAGDILVSIKGNVGVIGIVGPDATLAKVMGEPWVVSQSLAIIRWRPNNQYPSSEVLNAMLTAPWVREKLESMSGGATVRTLPISAVRSLPIPIPSAEECAEASEKLQEINAMREDIAVRVKNIGEARQTLWAHLWHVAPDFGDY